MRLLIVKRFEERSEYGKHPAGIPNDHIVIAKDDNRLQ
jgi:hypothetical protein